MRHSEEATVPPRTAVTATATAALGATVRSTRAIAPPPMTQHAVAVRRNSSG